MKLAKERLSSAILLIEPRKTLINSETRKISVHAYFGNVGRLLVFPGILLQLGFSQLSTDFARTSDTLKMSV
jgi:hypothetical protein